MPVGVGAVVMVNSYELGAGWSSNGPDSGYFPFYIGALIVLSSTATLLITLFSRKPNRTPFVESERFQRVLQVLIPSFIFAIAIERIQFLFFKASISKDAFIQAMRKYILAGNVGKALALCSQTPTPLSNIIKSGLVKVNKSDAEVQAAMDEASLREVPRLEKRTMYLAMLANVAMLAGLLGTISGLIKCFAAVATADPSEKASLLAAGIAEAMNCTAFGLIVAEP